MDSSREAVLLLVEIPKTNDKKELSAEQMFAALHGIYKPLKSIFSDGYLKQDYISFEIASIGQQIRFHVWTPKNLQAFVEGQIYAQYPQAQISEEKEDYAGRAMYQPVIYTSELVLTDNETLPIKSFPSFEVDPLAAITATLSKLDQPGEELWVQIITRPIGDEWHQRSAKMVSKIKSGKIAWSSGKGLSIVGQTISALIKTPEAKEPAPAYELTERDKTRISAIEEKSQKLGYQVKIRLVYAGNDQTTARARMQAMVGTFKQFNTTNLNGFQSKFPSFDPYKLNDYQARKFNEKGFILNIEEVASLYHLPHTTVETPNIVWATTKTAEPPANLPTNENYKPNEISLFGTTNFRGGNSMFGLLRADRGRHTYILGQTGTGKSGLLELLTLSDIYYDQGFAVIDPHGDYASNIIRYIPERRIKDVIYFNPADSEYPIGFNPLEIVDSTSKGQVSSELVGVLKRMFESWGPRLEYILRFTILALLDYPSSTMLDITRMLTEKKFRDRVVENIDDVVVKNFWTREFASWNEKFANEAVAPILNKVGAFTANPLVRNIIGQPKNSFNIRKAMDEGKIFIVNLSKGLIGEDNAAVLGAMLVTKIQLAAMSRSDIANINDRRPFYLYVDEFQNFATESFAVILSEARKYGLNLTVANQYISQMDEDVRNAVFGNVGTMITFRVSPDDSPFLIKYYEPQFEAADLSNFKNRNFVTNMSINGEKAAPFSGTTLNIPETTSDKTAEIIAESRKLYAHDRLLVEQGIVDRSTNTPDINTPASPQQPSLAKLDQTPRTAHTGPVRAPIGTFIKHAENTITRTIHPEKLTDSQKRRLRRKKAQSTIAQQATNPTNNLNQTTNQPLPDKTTFASQPTQIITPKLNPQPMATNIKSPNQQANNPSTIIQNNTQPINTPAKNDNDPTVLHIR